MKIEEPCIRNVFQYVSIKGITRCLQGKVQIGHFAHLLQTQVVVSQVDVAKPRSDKLKNVVRKGFQISN